jgi:hypothetical protein
MTALTLRNTWFAKDVASELDATMCKLTILVRKTNITHYTASRTNGGGGAFLEIPAYFLAEWIAENWWALLYEPKKNEEDHDNDFRQRHSILAAQHGLALPNLSIMPVGRAIHISAIPHRAKLAGVRFDNSAATDAPRLEIEEALAGFVNDCVDVLSRHGITETPLQRAWTMVKATSADQHEFCELAGSLGMSPYNAADDIADALDLLVDVLGMRATRDLCLAATSDVLLKTTRAAQDIASLIDKAPVADITPLSRVSLAEDNFHSPGWTRGLNAARQLAKALHAEPGNTDSASLIFERLGIDLTDQSGTAFESSRNWLPFNSAIKRDAAGGARLAIVPEEDTQRRFAAARAVYLAWISEAHSQRLATAAITRDQQASRQFAAELLVPRAYVQSRATKGQLSYDQAEEIARERRAGHWVVRHQANNSGIVVGSI